MAIACRRLNYCIVLNESVSNPVDESVKLQISFIFHFHSITSIMYVWSDVKANAAFQSIRNHQRARNNVFKYVNSTVTCAGHCPTYPNLIVSDLFLFSFFFLLWGADELCGFHDKPKLATPAYCLTQSNKTQAADNEGSLQRAWNNHNNDSSHIYSCKETPNCSA